MKELKNKIQNIAQKYAEMTEKRMTVLLQGNEMESAEINEINEGIRMLNHIASTLERIDRLNRSDETSGPN